MDGNLAMANHIVGAEPHAFEPITCALCGWTHNMPSEFVRQNEKEICLDCAGYAPPTCGEHGDF